MYSIRRAKYSDADAMAYVHATSWKETYTGLLDDKVISKFNIEHRKKMWMTFLQNETNLQRAYVAIYLDKIVGIASSHETVEHMELLTLYVLSEYQGRGIGKSLLKQVEQDAIAKRKRLITWVLKNNPATFFYAKMGFNLVKNEVKNLGDATVEEIMFKIEHTK